MKIKDERSQLENMLESSRVSVENNVTNNQDPIIPELHSNYEMKVDFDELRKTADEEAMIMIKNAISLMIPEDMIDGNQYLVNKMNMDSFSLAGMIYQLRCNEAMQKTLMEEVKAGFTHPRAFEVFAQLSKVIGELNKQLIQTIEAIKVTYRDLKQDIKDTRNEALGPRPEDGILKSGDGGVITRGTKELIRNVQLQKKQSSIQENIS